MLFSYNLVQISDLNLRFISKIWEIVRRPTFRYLPPIINGFLTKLFVKLPLSIRWHIKNRCSLRSKICLISIVKYLTPSVATMGWIFIIPYRLSYSLDNLIQIRDLGNCWSSSYFLYQETFAA